MTTKRRLFSAILLGILTPATLYADGVSPILNLFHKDTFLPASIVTLVIILVESGLLRWRIKSIPYSGILWRSVVINTASSITGSVLLLAFSRDSYFIWDTMSLVLPLFLITLVTEIPLLYLLFRNVPLSWKRAVLLGCGINIASYAAVFVLEIGLFFGLFAYAGHLDKQDLRDWNNPALVKQLSGRIYATDWVGSNHALRVYDPQKARWISLTNAPSIDPNKWDLKGHTFAFVKGHSDDWESRNLVVTRLPDFQPVLEVSPKSFADQHCDNWQGVVDVAVSPDESKLALLFRFTDAVAPKGSSGYFNLGDKCRLIVIDLHSGLEIARAERWASDCGICWLPDSRRILFSSFDEESVYRTTMNEVHGDTSYGSDYVREGTFKRSLYQFNIETGKITHFANGSNPSLAGISGDILVQDRNGVELLNSSGVSKERIEMGKNRLRRAVISPSGDLILAEIPRRSLFYGECRLVLVSTHSPNVRHVLDDGVVYKVDWTMEEGRRSDQEAVPSSGSPVAKP